MLTVAQAAARLGVGEEQVRRLVRSGELTASKVGQTVTLDEASVEGRARLPIRAGRALAPRTAWAALWELSGERADWLDRPARSRLRSRLRSAHAEQVVAALRMRATRHDLRVLPAYRDRVVTVDGVVPSGMSAAAAAGADIVSVNAVVEVCCTATRLEALRRDFGLSDRGQANLIVRVPRFDGLELTGLEHMPAAAVAVDLAESADARTRRAGLEVLAVALAGLGR